MSNSPIFHNDGTTHAAEDSDLASSRLPSKRETIPSMSCHHYDETGLENQYSISSLPILQNESIPLKKEVFQVLEKIVERIFDFTETEEYQEEMRKIYESLPFSPGIHEYLAPSEDTPPSPPCPGGNILPCPQRPRFASFDFHLGKDGETPKLIEFSYFPAGLHFWAGNLAPLVRGVPEAGGNGTSTPLPPEFTRENYEAELLKTCEGYERIAIIDEHIVEQHFAEELFWFRDFLEREGKTVFLAEAERLEIQKGKILITPWQQDSTLIVQKERVDFIFNRLPFADFLKQYDRFWRVGEVEKMFPRQISTTYQEWLYTEKVSFLILQNDPRIKAFLPTTYLSQEFKTSEELKKILSRNMVAKPLFSYGGKGVFPKPSHGVIQKILEDEIPYLFQEMHPATPLPDGRKYDIRLLCLNGKICSVLARVYRGAITNFKEEGSGICGVDIEGL